MKTLLSVMTCNHRQHTGCPRCGNPEYLTATLAGLDRNGADSPGIVEKIVWSDGPLPPTAIIPKSWNLQVSTILNGSLNGSTVQFWNLLKYAIEEDVDFLLSCEDDLVISEKAVTKMMYDCRTWIAEDWTFITYFDRILPNGTPEGYYSLPIKGAQKASRYFAGMQCLLLPRRTIDFLVTKNPDDCKQWDDRKNHQDVIMSHFLHTESPWKDYGVRVPGLVDHCGWKGNYIVWGTNYIEGPNNVPLNHDPNRGRTP